MVKKPRAGQTSYNFHLENLQLPGEIEDTQDEHEAEAEPGPSVAGAGGSRKRARTEEAHASGVYSAPTTFLKWLQELTGIRNPVI